MDKFMNHDFNVDKIIVACFIKKGMSSNVHKNRPSHGLAFHVGGEKVYTFSDGKQLVVQENDIIYLPKHSNYAVQPIIPGDCYAINFDWPDDITFEPFVVKIKNHTSVAEHFRVANKVWQLKKKGYITKCKSELYNIIYKLQTEYFSEYFPKNKFEVIKTAVDYIHSNYSYENISIDGLASMCSISTEYFRRIFKSFYGISPAKYIINLKVTRAKELLESQMYSVTDVARLSGFNELCYFCREFKKLTGVSPSEYKTSVQN